ncbi:MAG: hypothetical protein M1820_009051 [Bogoriella megaspora]|nr:MAG: hypothetical protein M1820_009051 [Bogoriella megaspora]
MDRQESSRSPSGTSPGQDDSSSAPTGGSSTSTFKAQSSVTPPKIRRRNRLITSCLECRRRKLKCDKLSPCSNCIKWNRDCLFLAPALDPTSQSKLAQIKEQMGSLERTLEEDVARSKREAAGGLFSAGDMGPQDDSELKELEPTPLSSAETVYEEDADDDLLDLGVQLGKLRITERIGGYARPKFGDELSSMIQDPHYDPTARDRQKSQSQTQPSSGQPPIAFQGASYVGPSPDYIAPSSSFFFAPEPTRSGLIDYLPSKAAADKLVRHYWIAVHPLVRIVHRQSFEQSYDRFWHDVSVGVEPPNSLQAKVMAFIFTAVVSMTDEQVMQEFGVQKATLVDTFRLGTEMALSKSNFLRTTKLETMQAFVMYLLPLCRAEVSRAHSALTGTAIRLAECMGIHRDGSLYGLSPVETHIRRLIWFQLCFLDIRTCEAAGPRPQIRSREEGGFDTKFPLNIEDEDLLSPTPPTEDAERWTSMTLPLIRMRAQEVQRMIWEERPKVDQQKTTITAFLGKLQRARLLLDARFLHLIDEGDPVQLLGKHVYHVAIDRWHISFLHRYHNSVAHRMPDRLRQLILTSGTSQIEHAVAVDTHPSLAPWRWYSGALQQYQTAVLLLFEVYAYPMRKEADRIWSCLDYIFDIPLTLTRDQKARLVMGELSNRMKVYHSLRRTRAPVQVEKMVGIKPPRRIGDGHRLDNPQNQQQAVSGSQQQHVPRSQQQISPPPAEGSRFSPPTNLPGSLPGTGQGLEYNFNTAPGVNAMSGLMGAANAGTVDQLYSQDPNAPHQWSPQPSNSDSPGSAFGMGGSITGSNPSDLQAVMDIDWNEFDSLFPPDQVTGDLNVPNWTYGNAIPMSNMDPGRS